MEFAKEVRKALGLAESETDEKVLGALTTFKAKVDATPAMEKQHTELSAKVTELSSQLETATKGSQDLKAVVLEVGGLKKENGDLKTELTRLQAEGRTQKLELTKKTVLDATGQPLGNDTYKQFEQLYTDLGSKAQPIIDSVISEITKRGKVSGKQFSADELQAGATGGQATDEAKEKVLTLARRLEEQGFTVKIEKDGADYRILKTPPANTTVKGTL